MALAGHINSLSFNFFIYNMGIIIIFLREYAREGITLVSTVGNTVDARYIAASLTVTRMVLSILSTWVLQLFTWSNSVKHLLGVNYLDEGHHTWNISQKCSALHMCLSSVTAVTAIIIPHQAGELRRAGPMPHQTSWLRNSWQAGRTRALQWRQYSSK